MKKILMIGTGGTIASARTDAGLSPLVSTEELLECIPAVRKICKVDTLQLFNIDSTDVHPKHWELLANTVKENYKSYDGFVICHGTDTLAYTAAALSYLIQNSPKPIVLTGSQKPMGMEVTDAKTNLLDSFIYASYSKAGRVQVVFNGKVILGTRARKVKTKSFDAFESVNYPYLAQIRDGQIFDYIHFKKAEVKFYNKVDSKVGMLKLIPGIDAELFAFYFEKYDAIILESYGVGGIPAGEYYKIHNEIQKWMDKNKTIVMTTQVANEGSNMEVYEVGYGSKIDYNIIEAYDMTTEACVAKMMWILGQTKEPEKIKEMFYTSISRDILYDAK